MSNPFLSDTPVVKKTKIQPATPGEQGPTVAPRDTTAALSFTDLAVAAGEAGSRSVGAGNLDKQILSGLSSALLFAGGSMVTKTKMDELDDAQLRFACASYFGIFPLIVLGHLSMPWLTILLSVCAAFFGYTFVGSPRTTIKLKETTVLCLSATCGSAWIESLGGALFGSVAGYGAPLSSVLRPKTAISFTLCRAPIALSMIGLLALGLRYVTVNQPKPSRQGTLIIAFTASTLMISGASSFISILTTSTLPPLHPLPFFGGPTRFVYGDQQSSLSLVLMVLLTSSIYIYRDTALQAELHRQYNEGLVKSEPGETAQMRQTRNRAEVWKRSFSGGRSSLDGSADDLSVVDDEIVPIATGED